jgi:hypothetical protein
MTTAWGVELSPDGEVGSLVGVSSRDGGGWRSELLFYRLAADLPDVLGGLYDGDPDAAGVFLDPMPCAAILDELCERTWVHRLEAVDVAAAAAQFRAAVKGRLVSAAPHPALEQALVYAAQRPLATAFGFERRKVAADMSPLNAAAFGLWGLRRNESLADPGVMFA